MISKLEDNLLKIIGLSLKNYIRAWHKIPEGMDINNLNIKRIRYVKDWGLKITPEDGFIIEFSSENISYKELLGRSELGLTIEEFKLKIEEQNKNGLLFGKSVTINQFWYEYPVIYGSLDEVFDDAYYYEKDGKYESKDYKSFGMKYD